MQELKKDNPPQRAMIRFNNLMPRKFLHIKKKKKEEEKTPKKWISQINNIPFIQDHYKLLEKFKKILYNQRIPVSNYLNKRKKNQVKMTLQNCQEDKRVW